MLAEQSTPFAQVASTLVCSSVNAKVGHFCCTGRLCALSTATSRLRHRLRFMNLSEHAPRPKRGCLCPPGRWLLAPTRSHDVAWLGRYTRVNVADIPEHTLSLPERPLTAWSTAERAAGATFCQGRLNTGSRPSSHRRRRSSDAQVQVCSATEQTQPGDFDRPVGRGAPRASNLSCGASGHTQHSAPRAYPLFIARASGVCLSAVLRTFRTARHVVTQASRAV